MELCTLSLWQAIQTKPSEVHESIVVILGEILSAVSHCHGLGVVHRDVKPENFLFGGEDGATLKLCDFGLAEVMPKAGFLVGVCGSAPYMAPEVVRCKPYNEKVDVWSVGVIAYLISFRRFPYLPKSKGSDAMKALIREGKPSPFFTSDERGLFLRKLLQRSEDNRCSALDALQSRFLSSKSVSRQLRRI
eukprot:TRINITY_DN10488_c0_g1_i1.p1 TRINITY_DN10488_c0_g1~~TRINITY_DN10488_c0_g1_i1.p1  ORF type:complete len:190 (-),score=19.67 TRINITY_DN10488_c0_g1_i1:715-1284(-)